MMKAMVAVAVLALAVQAWAEPDSPYRQHLEGVPLERIDCKAELVLIGSPDGVPACVTEDTALVLYERGWTTVDGVADRGRIIIDSRDLPVQPGAPEEYPHPVVIADYPEQMRVGQEYSIYIDYTYSQVPEPHSLPDSFVDYVNFGFTGEIDLLSTDFIQISESRGYVGGPYEYVLRDAHKMVDIDYELWYKEEIRFKINEPINYPKNVLHVSVGGTVIHRWLDTDDAGIVTVLETQNIPDAIIGEEESGKYRSRALTVPEDQGTGLPPIDDGLYEFLKEHVQPYWNVPEWLRDDEDFPQAYIDELLEAYPDLATPAEHTDFASGQSSAPRFFYLYGSLKVYDSSGNSIGAADVEACAKDVNLTTRTKSTLYNGATPSCHTTSSTGYFRERGDDSTQASVVIRTPESGTHPFDPDLDLSARQDGNTAHVSWTDSNGEGNDRHRVERAVGDG